MDTSYDDHGIRFVYPIEWELSVDEDGARTTVSLDPPESSAFALISVDEDRPDPSTTADEALEAMRENYPDLDAAPAVETIDGKKSIGWDVEFFCLDVVTMCTIRSYRSKDRTFMFLVQWTDLDAEETVFQLSNLRRAIEET